MSDSIETGPADDDLRAGEYVLGLGDPAERRAFEAELAGHPALAGALAAWERRFAPMAVAFAPVEPPASLWARIERSAFGTGIAAAAPPSRPGSWTRPLGAGVLGFALAASIAAVVLLERRPAPEPVPVAALLPKTAGAPVLVALREPGGGLVIRAVGTLAAPAGRDYELWSLPEHATAPVALGLLRDGVAVVAADRVPAGAGQILMSLERTGGSPTGLPQGPVLWGGAYRGGG